MTDARETLFLVRTRSFGPVARLLAGRLAATGASVAVVLDDRAGDADTVPFTTTRLSERRLADLGFSGLPADWRWLCGDLCYVLAADAHPAFAAFAMVESDVYLPEASAARLVAALRGHPADAIAAGLGPSTKPPKFSTGLSALGLDPSWGCLFPITRVSAEVVAEMSALRRDQLAGVPRARINDEAILAGAVQRRGFSFARLEAVVPDLVSAGSFATSPPFLFEALANDPEERRVFHPVIPHGTILERLRSGEKAYSRHRLRRVLRDAPVHMREEIEALLAVAGARRPGGRRHDLVRMNGLVAALAPQRPLRIADVGANPLIEGEVSYRRLLDAGHAEVVGFEPQVEALAQLNARKSRAELYLPHALGDGTPRTLHLTQSPGFTSVYPADPASAALLGFRRGMSVTERTEVATRRLDDCAEVPPIDFLKIDVQGSETAIIANGAGKLAEAVAIQTEVRFFPIYEGEPSFGALEAELGRQGFRFLRFATLKSVALSSKAARLRLRRADFAQVVDGDAFFVRDLRGIAGWSDEAVKRLALLADAVMDCPDLACFALEELVRRQVVADGIVDTYLGWLPRNRRR